MVISNKLIYLIYINFKMSLLIKTIQSYIPNWKDCCFVCEPWFMENYTLQINVLQLCFDGYADKIKYYDVTSENFIKSVNILLEENYEKYIENYSENFLKNLLKDIPIGQSLLESGWFFHSNHLHVIIFMIKKYGYKDYINDVEHLEQNLDNIVKIITSKQ
jgi:hypothetical protein